MRPVHFSINPGDDNPEVLNLKQVLLHFLDTNTLKVSRTDLQPIQSALAAERGYGDLTKKLVALFQEQQQLNANGVIDRTTATLMNDQLNRDNVLVQNPADTNNLVSGFLYTDFGLPAANIELRMYVKNFGGKDTLVTSSRTDEKGGYRLTYNAATLLADSIEMRSVDTAGKEYVLTGILDSKGLAANSPLNLITPSAVLPAAEPEFARLNKDLLQLVGGDIDKLADAQEHGDRQDISLLSHATNWDARAVAMGALARKLQKETSLGADVGYALLRSGLPAAPEQLAQLETTDIANALDTATKAGVVQLDEEGKKQALSNFQKFSAKFRLQSKELGGHSTYGDFLSKRGFDDAAQTRFATAYFAPRSSARELWDNVAAAGFSPEQVQDLKLQGKLAFLTLNNAPLTETLQAQIGGDLQRLVELGYADAASWDALLKQQANTTDDNTEALEALLPPLFGIGSIAARKKAYTEHMAAKVRQAYPQEVLRHKITSGAIKVKADRNVAAGVGSFLRLSENLGFDLGQTHVSSFAASHEAALFNGASAEEKRATIGAVQSLQRMYQISPDDDAMAVLGDMDIDAAHDIARLPESYFVNRFVHVYELRFQNVDKKRTLELARRIYDKAQQVTTTVYNFFTEAKQQQSRPAVFGVSGGAARRDTDHAAFREKVKDFPTLSQLFGSLDFCECAHCRSVLSPAAYFVDILRFLDPGTEDWAYFLDQWKANHNNEDYEAKYIQPFKALTKRRPDLPHIPLTCENTNTAMPYIDVVNEILEYFVVHGGITAAVAHDTAGASSAELLAEPQYVEPKAYSELKKTVYPIGLPFNLWLQTVRSFCNHYQTPLRQVAETVRPLGTENLAARKQVALEELGLSPEEGALLTSVDLLDELPGLYGYTNIAAMRSALQSAKTLAGRLGVTYKELVQLVQTRFINPNIGSLELLQKMGVQIGDVFSYKQDPRFRAFSEAEAAAFAAQLDLMRQSFGIDAAAELEQLWTSGVCRNILLLNDTNATCNFEQTEVGYADRAATDTDWLRLNLFVRLWRKLGWTMAETDQALNTFIPAQLLAVVHDGSALEATRAGALAQGLESALLSLGHFSQLLRQLRPGKKAVVRLCTLWSDLSTTGKQSLYAQLFLSRNILKVDPVFDHPLGRYLTGGQMIRSATADHTPALQAALNLSASELLLILQANGLTPETAPLSMATVSLLYRYGVLAKALRMSLPDLLLLRNLSGLDPFTSLPQTAIASEEQDVLTRTTLPFVACARQVKASGFSLEDLDYLCANRFDPIGKFRNVAVAAANFTKTLRDGIALVLSEHVIPSDAADPAGLAPFMEFTDEMLQQKLSLAVSAGTLRTFFAMWTGQQTPAWTAVGEELSRFLSEDQFGQLFAPRPESLSEQDHLLGKRRLLVTNLLQYIRNQRIGGLIEAQVAAAFELPPSLAAWLLADGTRLNIGNNTGASLMDLFRTAPDTAAAGKIKAAFTLLDKVQRLVAGFNLSETELRYLLAKPAGWEEADLSLMDAPDLMQASELFRLLLRLDNYRQLRQALAAGGPELVPVFGLARQTYEASVGAGERKIQHLQRLYDAVALLVRRPAEAVADAARLLQMDARTQVLPAGEELVVWAPDFADEKGLDRLWRLLQMGRLMGLTVDALQGAADMLQPALPDTAYPQGADLFRKAVKSRFEPDDWNRVAQPIFDKLRQAKRDALTALLLHRHNDLFGTREEMYEYLLIDPGMEPVVQTSRIRMATASVQLFIQRCLLNLETRWLEKVPPGAINAKHWAWMNRYRVWEANRKIFLFPENWLEPEWRDDKSHLFQELEGKLLQGDVSEEMVEAAFFGYLRKLEELARLEIVTTHCEEDALDPRANVLHVLGRTYSFPHQYFYRSFAQQVWSPWQPVETEIEGDHILLTKWRGRMHLFWVSFMEKIAENTRPATAPGDATKLGDWSVAAALNTVASGSDTKVIEATLHWSECHEGKWATRQSGGYQEPMRFLDAQVNTTARDLQVYLRKEPSSDGDARLDGALRISLRFADGRQHGVFRLVNKNVQPQIDTPGALDAWQPWPYGGRYRVNRILGDAGAFNVGLVKMVQTTNGKETDRDEVKQNILSASKGPFNLVPGDRPVRTGGPELGPLLTPFFYQDNWHTFYIEPSLTEKVTLKTWETWVDAPPIKVEKPKWEIPPIDPIYPWPKRVPIPKPGDPGWLDLGDERIKVTPQIRQDWMTRPGTFVKFGDRVIGKETGLNVALLSRNKVGATIAAGTGLDTIIANAPAENLVLVPAVTANNPVIETVLQQEGTKLAIPFKPEKDLIVGTGGLSLAGATSPVKHLGGVFDAPGIQLNKSNKINRLFQ